MTWPCWLRRAARNRHRHAIEQASRRWRGGRRGDSGRTRRKFDFHTGRWSSEHWPGSHPSVRACDVLDSEYDSGYSQFPRDAYPIKWALAPWYRNGHPYRTRLKRNVRDVVAEWRAVYNETAPASSLLLRHYVETRQPPIDTRRPGRPGKKNADLPRRKKKSAFQGRKNWSPREVAAAIADEAGRNNI